MEKGRQKHLEGLRAWYPMDDPGNPAKDAAGGYDGKIEGSCLPEVKEVGGRMAAVFVGGANGTSYIRLPENVLGGVGDNTGFAVSAWVRTGKHLSPWERIVDFGSGMGNPYIFLTRSLRAVCFLSEDIAADAGRPGPENEWQHIVLSVTGTKGGTQSSAGPRLYVNGELAADGWISQTSSGMYKKYREWIATLDDGRAYTQNYIARSQFDADPDFCGAICDVQLYERDLNQEEILQLLCASLEPEDILKLARDKYLPAPVDIVSRDLDLPVTLMDGQVQVSWSSDHPDVLDDQGHFCAPQKAVGVALTAVLSCQGATEEKRFLVTAVSDEEIPREITVFGDKKILDVSPVLYGIFYEDINKSADGGLYAEMIQNRSFEEFHFDTYDFRSGENGISTGRIREPLKYWFGDIDKLTPCLEGGLRDHFGLKDPDANASYVKVADGAKIYNHGFCDNNFGCSMPFHRGENYHFSIWAKPKEGASLEVVLQNADGKNISRAVRINLDKTGVWTKYSDIVLSAEEEAKGKIALAFSGETAIDMVSLMPDQVWGAGEEKSSPTAHKNFSGNPNYRLRRDLVQTLKDMNPAIVRFPGGCISEGSYIWDNVYDWKDSVDIVEKRKENFNVWGYTMTMGIGYMEYFQLSEDLGAEPLPVMACGVLCQARSDYANPAGGTLQEKYIRNFTDLIDFAISTDFESCKWAKLRKEMGHEEPFGLHYLGVGNENWGTEFYASFEAFKYAIDRHMQKNYPGYDLTIISTAGAQADDDAYQYGWRFLAGYQKGTEKIRFTDGKESFEKEVSWYPHQKNYLETIVDEHYYRSNDYLLENVDRYNYYYRPVDENGKSIEDQISKVFVGEYASSDKNTLAGAVAEAAVMTGFEKNADVVRLATTAPLFNRVAGDGTYRWTPDAIWLDDDAVWRTPTYYVQSMFAGNIGTRVLDTAYTTYEAGKKNVCTPRGGVLVRIAGEGAEPLALTVISNKNDEILFKQDFTNELSNELKELSGEQRGWYLEAGQWQDYRVILEVDKKDEETEIALGAGLRLEIPGSGSFGKASVWEYCVGRPGRGTGLRVIKNGREGYTLGDYSSSVFAGNLRACYDEPVAPGKYTITVDFGGADGRCINCWYEGDDGEKKAVLENKLEAYVRDLFYSATEDDDKIYIKVVNADDYDKKYKLNLEGVQTAKEAVMTVLTGEAELVHRPNVNTREAEPVKPVTGPVCGEDNSFSLTAAANSVAVVVIKKEER